MPHQVALTVVAPLRAGARPQLDEALAAAAVPFGQLAGVHFARIFVLDEGVAADGSKTSAKLVWMSDVDAPLDRHAGRAVPAGRAGSAVLQLRRLPRRARRRRPARLPGRAHGAGCDRLREHGRPRARPGAAGAPAARGDRRPPGRPPRAAQQPRQRRHPRGDPRLRGRRRVAQPRADTGRADGGRLPQGREAAHGAGARAAGGAAAGDPGRAALLRGGAAHPRETRCARRPPARRPARRAAGGARGPLDPEPVHRGRVDQAGEVSSADHDGRAVDRRTTPSATSSTEPTWRG